MTASDTAASTSPTVECSAWCPPTRARTDSTPTKAASAKKDTAMMRSVVRSRRSWSVAENCQATAAAEATSITESSPKPIRAVDEAPTPAVIATTASTAL